MKEARGRERAGSSAADEVPLAYLEDASGFRGYAERLIVPADEAGVVAALGEASSAEVPLTIAGAGTGVTGARVPMGGWVLSLEKFTRLEIGQGYAIAGAGVLLRDLDLAARQSAQFYPPDPTETSASVGGTVATNASGARSFKYGATRRWIERLRVVLADGRVIDAGRGDTLDFDPGTIPLPEVTKNTAGYQLRSGMDWIDLFTGSEGTLGVITEAQLRLLPAPAGVLAGVIFFSNDNAALDAVDDWRATASARVLEYFDRPSLALLRGRFPEIPSAASAAILFEQELAAETAPDEVGTWLARTEAAHALAESWLADSATDRERFRRFRHALPELVNDTVRRNGTLKMGTDHAVPIAHNREMLEYYRRRLEAEFPDRYVIFGHIGDAHLHVNMLPSPEDAERASALLAEFARRAVALGGTVSAEHGLGRRKAHLLAVQYAPDHLARMRAVKRRLDFENLLGRGVLWAE